MTLNKEPFRTFTLDNDKKDPLEVGKVFTIRLNAAEYRQLKEDMKDLNIRNESTCYKLLSECGRNVLHGTFGRDRIRWLFNRNRVKLEPD